MIGEQSLIDHEFEYNGNPPPAIYATDASTALKLCQNMTDTDIDIFRIEMTNWWVNNMNIIRSHIDSVIDMFHS